MKFTRKMKNLAEYIPFITFVGLLKAMPANVSTALLLFLFDTIGYQLGVRRKLAEQQLNEVFPI